MPEYTVEFYKRQIQHEKEWMESRGGDLNGYIKFYGSKNDPDHYGGGGEAIYAADLAVLNTLKRRLVGALRTELEAAERDLRSSSPLSSDKCNL